MKRNFPSAVLLLVLVGISPGTASYSSETRCFADQNQHGEWFDFNGYAPDLAVYHFDNTIESVKETGMWMYYDNVEYNTHQAGLVFWASGVDFSGNVPAQYANMATSLRYAGSPYSLEDETWTVYSGEAFTGHELKGFEDAASLGSLGDDVSSIIIVGQSAWTFYDGRDFHGTNSVCLRPNFKFSRDSDGRSLHVGIFPSAFVPVQLGSPVRIFLLHSALSRASPSVSSSPARSLASSFLPHSSLPLETWVWRRGSGDVGLETWVWNPLTSKSATTT